jgi:Holliday junction resolvasome RuvABC endonuclease subunit
MIVVGLDPSLTSFGVVQAEPGGLILPSRLCPKTRGHVRLEYLAAEAVKACRGAALAVLEGVAFAAKGNALLDLAGLNTLIRHELWRASIPYAQVAPTQLKLYATGSAGASKQQVLTAALRRMPLVDVDGDDQADALWLAAMGCDWLGSPLCKVPEAQRAVLSAVHADKGRRGKPKIVWPVLDAEPVAPALFGGAG